MNVFAKNKSISQIHRALPEDYFHIARIYNSYISKGSTTLESRIFSVSDIANWCKEMGDREGLFVIKQDSIVLGWGKLKQYNERPGYCFSGETSVYIDLNWQGMGLGSELKLFLMHLAKSWSYHHLVSRILMNNKASIQYNLKLGYETVGIQKEVGYQMGNWVDLVIMQYIFKE